MLDSFNGLLKSNVSDNFIKFQLTPQSRSEYLRKTRVLKFIKVAKIRNCYNQVSHLTQDAT